MGENGSLTHLWDVQGSEPGDKSWSNVRHFVLAPSMESAIATVRAEHPDIVLHQAIRRSSVTAGAVLVAPDANVKPGANVGGSGDG